MILNFDKLNTSNTKRGVSDSHTKTTAIQSSERTSYQINKPLVIVEAKCLTKVEYNFTSDQKDDKDIMTRDFIRDNSDSQQTSSLASRSENTMRLIDRTSIQFISATERCAHI